MIYAIVAVGKSIKNAMENNEDNLNPLPSSHPLPSGRRLSLRPTRNIQIKIKQKPQKYNGLSETLRPE
jgi:hypothetical protein